MNQPLIVLVAPLAAEVAAAAAVEPVAAAVEPVAAAAVEPVAAAVEPVAAAAVVSLELGAVTERSTLPRPGIAWEKSSTDEDRQRGETQDRFNTVFY